MPRYYSAFQRQIDDYNRRSSSSSSGGSGSSDRSAALQRRIAEQSASGNASQANANFSSTSGQSLYIPPPEQFSPVDANTSTADGRAVFSPPPALPAGGGSTIQAQQDGFLADVGGRITNTISASYDAVAQDVRLNTMMSSDAFFGTNYTGSNATYSAPIQVPVGSIPKFLTKSGKGAANVIRATPKTIRQAKDWVREVFFRTDRLVTTVNQQTGKVTSTVKTTSGIPISLGKAIAIASGFVLAGLGSKGLGKFMEQEAMQTITFTISQQLREGDAEGAKETIALGKDLFYEQDLQDFILSFIPGYEPIKVGIEKNIPAGMHQIDAMDAIADDIIEQVETGKSNDQIWQERHQMELDEIKAYDETARAREEWLLQLRADAKTADRKEAIRYYEEQLALKEEFEAEQRRLNLEYWETYWRLSLESKAATAPSKLSFGII